MEEEAIASRQQEGGAVQVAYPVRAACVDGLYAASIDYAPKGLTTWYTAIFRLAGPFPIEDLSKLNTQHCLPRLKRHPNGFRFSSMQKNKEAMQDARFPKSFLRHTAEVEATLHWLFGSRRCKKIKRQCKISQELWRQKSQN